jgi:hypothetical protein
MAKSPCLENRHRLANTCTTEKTVSSANVVGKTGESHEETSYLSLIF